LPDGSVSAPSLGFADDSNTGLFSSAADTLNFTTGGVERMELGATTIFNEDGEDVDFRIEGDSEANLFYVDAGNDRIGIATNSPATALDLNGDLTITDKIIHSGDTNTFIRFPSADTFTVETAGSERVRVDSSGNLGINDTSPTAELSVAATAPHIDLGVAGSTRMKIGYEGNNCFFGGTDASAMFLFKVGVDVEGHPQASGTERMRIDNNGRVGINVTAPDKMLEINNSGKTGTSTCLIHASGSDNVRVVGLRSSRASGGTSAHMIEFFDSSGSNVGNINSNGSSTSYNTSSDYRLKENVVGISDGITRLKTLKPYRFNFKSNPTATVDGFLAHEVTAVPEAITGTKDQVATADDVSNEIKEGDPIYQGIDQSKLVPLLVAAVQELIGKVEALEAA